MGYSLRTRLAWSQRFVLLIREMRRA
jgi:hypothetical protein